MLYKNVEDNKTLTEEEIKKNEIVNNFTSKFDLEILPKELKENIKKMINQYLIDRSDLMFDMMYWQVRANLNYYEIERIVPKYITDIIRREMQCLF